MGELSQVGTFLRSCCRGVRGGTSALGWDLQRMYSGPFQMRPEWSSQWFLACLLRVAIFSELQRNLFLAAL